MIMIMINYATVSLWKVVIMTHENAKENWSVKKNTCSYEGLLHCYQVNISSKDI